MAKDIFTLDNFDVEMRRLSDLDYRALYRRSVGVSEDGTFFLHCILLPSRGNTIPRLNLAEFRFVMEHFCGASGVLYDDYKESFSFPFAVTITKDDQTYPYVLNICDWRGSLEFAFRKIVAREEEANGVVRPPFPEFSQGDIREFIAHFYGFMIGYFESASKMMANPPAYVAQIASSCIVYGYKDGRFFEKHFDSGEEFDQAVAQY